MASKAALADARSLSLMSKKQSLNFGLDVYLGLEMFRCFSFALCFSNFIPHYLKEAIVTNRVGKKAERHLAESKKSTRENTRDFSLARPDELHLQPKLLERRRPDRRHANKLL